MFVVKAHSESAVVNRAGKHSCAELKERHLPGLPLDLESRLDDDGAEPGERVNGL